jgi:hypothetical protein
MSDQLIERIRAAAPNLLKLTEAETCLLEAHLEDQPEAPTYCGEPEYDADKRVGSIGFYKDPADEELWILKRATLKYNQQRLRDAEPQLAADVPTPAAPAEPPPEPTPPAEPLSKLGVALVLLSEHPDWTDKAIAEAAGCSGAYLSQNKRYQAARNAIKGIGQESRKRSRKHRGSDMDEYADG